MRVHYWHLQRINSHPDNNYEWEQVQRITLKWLKRQMLLNDSTRKEMKNKSSMTIKVDLAWLCSVIFSKQNTEP